MLNDVEARDLMAVTTDPVFGEMTFAHRSGWWSGTVRFEPTDQVVSVFVATDRAGPTEEHHHAFRDLCRRYGEITPEIAGELLKVYGSWGDYQDLPSPRTAEGMWTFVRLEQVVLKSEH